MITTIDKYKKAADSIVRMISKVLPKSDFEYSLPYSGRSVVIRGINSDYEDTYIYIRVTYTDEGFIADISNIDLSDSIRHKGVFKKIVNELKKSRTISGIWVSQVLTDDMHIACNKLGMQRNDRISGYMLLW